jgi:type I restriction enzyme M protein
VDKVAIKSAIYDHPQFVTFIVGMNAHFAAWRERSAATLKTLTADFTEADLASLSEDLLAHYKNKPLIDPYDIYQHLMVYWAAIMQDDCYLIAADGWKPKSRASSRPTGNPEGTIAIARVVDGRP